MRRVHADALLREAQQTLLLRVRERERLERAEYDRVCLSQLEPARCSQETNQLLTVGHNHRRGYRQGFVDDGASQVYGEEDDVLPWDGLVGPVRRLEEHWRCEQLGQIETVREDLQPVLSHDLSARACG